MSLNGFPLRVADTSIRAGHNAGLSCHLQSGKQAREVSVLFVNLNWFSKQYQTRVFGEAYYSM